MAFPKNPTDGQIHDNRVYYADGPNGPGWYVYVAPVTASQGGADSDWVTSQIPVNQVDSDWVLSQIPVDQIDSDWVTNYVTATLNNTDSDDYRKLFTELSSGSYGLPITTDNNNLQFSVNNDLFFITFDPDINLRSDSETGPVRLAVQ
mgnify:CR=1 FL=1